MRRTTASAASASASLVAVAVALLSLVTNPATSTNWRSYKGVYRYQESPRCNRSASGTEFLLRTANGVGCVQEGDRESLTRSGWTPGARVVFIIHGAYEEEGAWDPWVQATQYGLALHHKCNAFAVAWHPDFLGEDAGTAGNETRRFISWLNAVEAVKFSDIHLVGFEHGVRVASAVGSLLSSSTEGGGKIGRITALDPVQKSPFQLKSTDAALVVVIRTKDQKLDQPQIGHVDFYVNGGVNLDCFYSPNHDVSAQIFVRSVYDTDSQFGKPCESFEKFRNGECGICAGDCVTMGYEIQPIADQPAGAARALGGRYYSIVSQASRVNETQMIHVNLTVNSNFEGRFKASLCYGFKTRYKRYRPFAFTLMDKFEKYNTIVGRVVLGSIPKVDYQILLVTSGERNWTHLTAAMTEMRTGNRKLFCNTQPTASLFLTLTECTNASLHA